MAYLAVVILLTFLILTFLSATSTKPGSHGLKDGRLTDCPKSPNCVSSQASSDRQRLEPILFSGSPEQAMQRIKSTILTLPRTHVVEERGDYLHIQARSRVFRFVDDIEFLLDREASEIHFRSASRTGYSDFGVNRARVEQLRRMFSTMN